MEVLTEPESPLSFFLKKILRTSAVQSLHNILQNNGCIKVH